MITDYDQYMENQREAWESINTPDEPQIIYIVVSDDEVITFSSSDRPQAYESFGNEIDYMKAEGDGTKASFGWVYDTEFYIADHARTLKKFTEEESFISTNINQ